MLILPLEVPPFNLFHEIIQHRLPGLHGHQGVKVTAFIFAATIKLHQLFVESDLLPTVFVVPNQEGLPVILVRGLEKTVSFFMMAIVVEHLKIDFFIRVMLAIELLPDWFVRVVLFVC